MLADAGRSGHHSVIARAASPSVNYAAQELQHHITRAAPSTSGRERANSYQSTAAQGPAI